MIRISRLMTQALLVGCLLLQLPALSSAQSKTTVAVTRSELIAQIQQSSPDIGTDRIAGGNVPITRGDAARLVQSLLHLSDSTSHFSDVPSGNAYANAAGSLAKAGIMNGIGGGKFGPSLGLTEDQAGALADRIAVYLRKLNLNADSVEGLTIAQIEAGLRSKAFTCQELIGAYTDRIEAYDRNGPELNAVISLNPNAEAEAAKLDQEQKSGKPTELAHCVPVVVKDVINTTEMPTTEGSELFKNWTPDNNATVISRLEKQGAIILAKTNLDDFAAAVYGISSLQGAMKNPYDLARTVGGSSGGSAVAVAAQYAPLAIGTDTGGSLRIPAALTGVVTIRPTMGLVSQNGIFPRAITQDTAGPLAATVQDAATGLDLIAGYDPADPQTARSVGKIPASGYASFAKGGRLDGMKIGLVTGGLAIWGDQPNGPVVALLRQAAKDIEALGGQVVEISAPDKDLLGGSSVITFESARDVTKFLSEQGGNVPVKSFKELYESGKYTPYAKESYDREIKIDIGTLSDNLDYQKALNARTKLQDWTLNTMAEQGLSAIAYPSSAQLADLITKEQAGLFSRWSENTGFPSISVPMGYADSNTGTSMPANIEFLGRAFDEPTLIRIASAYENATHKRVAPPLPAILSASSKQ